MFYRIKKLAFITCLLLMVFMSSCFGQSAQSAYFDAGANDLTVTGQQMSQYVVYRFDTNSGARSMTLPSATDIINQIGSPIVGQVFIMAVTAEGSSSVMITGGTGVTVKTSAASVAANTTQALYFIIMNTTAGSQAITVF